MVQKNGRFIFSIPLNFLLGCTSYIVPKERNFFILGAREGNFFADNPKYLYLYANKIKDKNKFVWITRSKEVFKKLKGKKLPVLYMNSLKTFWSILRAEKLIISNTSEDVSYYKLLPGRFKFIEVWHGSPIKELPFPSKGITMKGKINGFMLRKEYANYEFVLHTCERTKDQLENCFVTKNVNILGYPRNDYLFKPTNFERLPNTNKYKKILFYLPTYRDKKPSKPPFTKKGLEDLNKFLKEKKYLLIVKKHFAEKNLEIIKEEYSNIIDVSYITDCQEILSRIDILIADYSSATFDFSLLNKPIIFYPYDYNEYRQKSRKIIIDYFNELPGPFACTEKDLIKLIKNVEEWFKDKDYKKKYKKFVDKFNKFQDANSSKRVYEEIINKG